MKRRCFPRVWASCEPRNSSASIRSNTAIRLPRRFAAASGPGCLRRRSVAIFASTFRASIHKRRRALALANGDPLMVTAPLGRGRVVLVATAGSLASVDRASGEPWTTWPAWPSFLPVVRDASRLAVGGQHDQWQALVGEPLVGTLPMTSGSRELELTRSGRSQSFAAGGNFARADVAIRRHGRRGNLFGSKAGGTDVARFAVNVNTQESDLAKVDPHQLPAEIAVRTDWRNSDTVVASGVLPGKIWNRSLLWGAAVLVSWNCAWPGCLAGGPHDGPASRMVGALGSAWSRPRQAKARPFVSTSRGPFRRGRRCSW